jgi:hypothetical protein
MTPLATITLKVFRRVRRLIPRGLRVTFHHRSGVSRSAPGAGSQRGQATR